MHKTNEMRVASRDLDHLAQDADAIRFDRPCQRDNCPDVPLEIVKAPRNIVTFVKTWTAKIALTQ